MKTFKQIISEVAEPLGDDEKRFKAKHVIQKIDHPVADENQFTAKNTKKDKSKISGYKNGDDEIVYEAKMMTCEDCGEEYDSDGECDCEDDEEEDDDLDEATLTDTEKKKREHIVTGMKKSEADLKARYGDKWKSLMYATATKHALHSEAKKAKPGHNAAVMAKNIGKVLSAVKTEEAEHIDEISRDLARNYIGKVADKKNTGEASPKEVAKRSAGVALAGKKAYDIGGKAKVKATEEVDLDEGVKEKIGGMIRREKEKEYPLLQNRRDVAASKAAKSYAAGDKKKGDRYMKFRSDNMKKEEVESSKYDTPAKKKPVSMMTKDEKDKNNERRNAYKDYQKSVRKESVDLDEAFKAGSMKLNDGSSVTLTNESSNALNTLFNQLTSTNKTKMEQRLMSGPKGFNEILAFAKEV